MSGLTVEDSGDLGWVFREKMAADEETAATFHISISRRQGGRLRVAVDASVDEEAVGRLVDQAKVRQMRHQRTLQQQELEPVPHDDGYRVKPRRRALSAAEERPRNKVLTKTVVRKKEEPPKAAKKQQHSKKAVSESELARRRLIEEEEKKKQMKMLPDFCKPFIKLRDVAVDPDWTRPAPPRFHGLHMHTQCFQRRERAPQWCEKVPVFQRFLTQAERVQQPPGRLASHLEQRSRLYDGMCQELMRLEERHLRQPRAYAPLRTNCHDCQRYTEAAQGVFFKTSHADFERDAMQAPQPSHRFY